LARFRLGCRENVGNSNVASPTPNPGRTWPGAGWAVGKCGQFERGISHAESWSHLAMFWLGSLEYLCNSNVAVFGGWKIVNLGPFRFWRLPFRFVPDVEDPVSPCVSICLLAIGTAGSGSSGSAESLTREGA
jgi:hypothetical protein